MAPAESGGLALSPDGSLIAAGRNGIRIHQVETGTLLQTLPAQTDPLSATNVITGFSTGVGSLAFRASGQLASAGADGTMRLWCSP